MSGLVYYKSPFHVTRTEEVADDMCDKFDSIVKIEKVLRKLKKLELVPKDMLLDLEQSSYTLLRTYENNKKDMKLRK